MTQLPFLFSRCKREFLIEKTFMSIKPVVPQTIPADVPKPRNDKVYQAAKMYENQFLRDMVKAMRQTVTEGELLPTSMGEKIFREQLDQQYVEGWSDRGGIGFADMIYDHIMDRYYNSKRMFQKPATGGIPLEKASGTIKPMNDGTKINLKPSEPGKPQAINAPWGGELQQVTENGKSFGIIRHDNGLESQISYSGLALRAEGRVEAGEKIGLKNAGPEDVLWYVKTKT
jgi:peptidoglycan hydrolase FlgJ